MSAPKLPAHKDASTQPERGDLAGNASNTSEKGKASQSNAAQHGGKQSDATTAAARLPPVHTTKGTSASTSKLLTPRERAAAALERERAQRIQNQQQQTPQAVDEAAVTALNQQLAEIRLAKHKAYNSFRSIQADEQVQPTIEKAPTKISKERVMLKTVAKEWREQEQDIKRREKEEENRFDQLRRGLRDESYLDFARQLRQRKEKFERQEEEEEERDRAIKAVQDRLEVEKRLAEISANCLAYLKKKEEDEKRIQRMRNTEESIKYELDKVRDTEKKETAAPRITRRTDRTWAREPDFTLAPRQPSERSEKQATPDASESRTIEKERSRHREPTPSASIHDTAAAQDSTRSPHTATPRQASRKTTDNEDNQLRSGAWIPRSLVQYERMREVQGDPIDPALKASRRMQLWVDHMLINGHWKPKTNHQKKRLERLENSRKHKERRERGEKEK